MVSRIVYTFFKSQSERLVHIFTVELKTILSNKKKCSSIFGVVHYNTNGVPKRQISFFKKQYQKHIYELDKTLQCRRPELRALKSQTNTLSICESHTF